MTFSAEAFREFRVLAIQDGLWAPKIDKSGEPAPGYAVARHVISRGKHLWVSLEIHPANVAGFANALP